MEKQKTMKMTVLRYRPEQDKEPWEQTLMFLTMRVPHY